MMIEASYFWQNIILLALGTIGIRFSIIAISSRIVITERTKEVFSFIPAAILPALVTPMVFFHRGDVEWLMGKERFAVLFLITFLCAFYRSTLVTILSGLVLLYIFRWVSL